jgi:hypothetical protein
MGAIGIFLNIKIINWSIEAIKKRIPDCKIKESQSTKMHCM